MSVAIAEAELARGTTGDNPWVGCVLIDGRGEIVGRGHTLGPGEDHAEVCAAREAAATGRNLHDLTMFSTLEPCSFDGRTRSCSRLIIERGIRRVVFGMRDPNPRVDGEGARILRDVGIEVIESVCEKEVCRQLGSWVLAFHPHEVRRRASSLTASLTPDEVSVILADLYRVTIDAIQMVIRT